MTVATALASADDPLPQLAEQAVGEALRKSGLTHANGLLLFLTPDFARHAQQAVTAAARAAQCTQVAGGIAAGVFTEDGWTLDRPAAAVMVFGKGLSLGHPAPPPLPAEAILSYAGSAFPSDWSRHDRRFGGSFSGPGTAPESHAWQQSRLCADQGCSVQLLGAHTRIGVSSGLRLLGEAQRIEQSNNFDLVALGGRSAQDSLRRALPPELQARQALPLHQLTAVITDGELAGQTDAMPAALAEGRYHPAAIIAANADGSLTLAAPPRAGQCLTWAIRQPITAEADMRKSLQDIATRGNPLCALMFSCIGRGPYFYGGEDRDLDVLRERYPGLPLLGVYGTGQIAPGVSGNRQLHNAVVTALVSR